MPTPVNIVGAGEHVGDIEQSNRTVKEHTRSRVQRLPYKVYPIEMVCGCLTKVVKDINIEVAEDGLSDVLSPGTLITGRVDPSYKEVQSLNFGDYVQAHVPETKTNTNEARTTGAIALYPSRNGQGSWRFMSLDTGRRIHRYSWDVLPISTDVINRVNAIGRSEKQPIVASNFKFQWGPDGENIDDESDSDDDEDFDDDDDDDVPPPPPGILEIDEHEAEVPNEQLNNDNDEPGAQNDNEVDDDREELGARDGEGTMSMKW